MTSSERSSKSGPSVDRYASKTSLDRRDVEPDAEARGDVHRVLHALRAGVRRRHREGAHPVRSQRVDRERGDEGRIDPAGEAEDDVVEPVLTDVVP